MLSDILILVMLLWTGVTLTAPAAYWWLFGFAVLFKILGYGIRMYNQGKGDRS